MKKILNMALSAVLLTGCSDFLEEDNRAGISNDELYVSAEGYQTLRVNAYSSLRAIYEETPRVLLAGTDLYQLPRNNTDPIYDYVNLTPTNADVKTFYTDCYTVLQALNTAEHYLSIAEISDGDKGLYQAEYNFLKGFVHFLLIEQFGGVVINDEYTQSPRTSIPRATLSASYDYVIAKLKAALDGPLPQTTKDGTINKDVVNHYLAKAYLTRGWDLGSNDDFAQAKAYANAVITSRGDLKYSMENLWSIDNENNDEVIFAIQYDASSLANNTSGNDQEASFGPYLSGSERGHKGSRTSLYPSWSLHSWFGKDDARYSATFMLTIWEFYYDYYQNKTNPEQNAVTAVYPRAWDKAQEMFDEYKMLVDGEANGQFTGVRMAEADGETLRTGVLEFIKKWCPEFSNADITKISNAKASNGTNYLRVYPFIEHSSDPKANEKYWRSDYASDFCQPVIKKFDMNKIVTWNQRQSYRDVVLATLSETMLLYAEACIGREEYSSAEEYIQKVLDRPGNVKPGGSPLTVSLPNTSRQAALEEYLKESGKELAGQYCGRWPELRRTKMLEYMFVKYSYDVTEYNLGSTPIGQKTYRPIPQDAIDINDGLTNNDQNPGYNS
ncbi:MAG: RagB/SusD family nutrient uptake outer membrane protein [Prevotellaceae bacterium]|jgi:hypothetical protein|nr:RagB/SusD family nutrient uptake outer membrane protein [Prevotellaceae bacterium]